MTMPTTDDALSPPDMGVMPPDVEAAAVQVRADSFPNEPKPTQEDIEQLYEVLKSREAGYFDEVMRQRDVRYLRDTTPDKWQKQLQDGRRFHSRISHNEIMRICGIMTKNMPRVIIPPSANDQKAISKGAHQTRWAQNLIAAFEKQAPEPVIRPHMDNVLGDGRGFIEIFMKENSIYDNLKDEPQDIFDPDINTYRPETEEEVNARLDASLVGAKLPFGWRRVSPLSAFVEYDEDGISRALIVEEKPYRPVFRRLQKRGKAEGMPRPGDMGWAPFSGHAGFGDDGMSAYWRSSILAGSGSNNASDKVLTMRYYDRTWYAYIVGGVLIDGPVKHNLPGVPLFRTCGLVTGAEDNAERYQGVTWGTIGIETLINDMMTLQADSAYTFSRPRPILTAPADVRIAAKPPENLDLSGLNGAPYAEPGYDIKDAFRGFEPRMTSEIIGSAMQFWETSGLAPVSRGIAPGADFAAVSANLFMDASESMYMDIVHNWERTLGNIIDFVRAMVRDTIGEKVGLPAIAGGSQTAEWLTLAPEDVDDVPAQVTLDIRSDANKYAITAQLAQLNKEGFAPRDEVQLSAGADDTQLWDDKIIIDTAMMQLSQLIVQMAMQVVGTQAAQRGVPLPMMGGGMPGQPGQPQPGQPGQPPQSPAGPGQPDGGPPAPGQPARPFESRAGAAFVQPTTARTGQIQSAAEGAV